MKNYEPVMSFDRATAAVYDDEPRGDEDAAVGFLASRAGDGPALELAIGTGRIALPLAARGVRVDGIDLSQAMVDRLRSKPGGDRLTVTIGDFADVGVPACIRWCTWCSTPCSTC
jgi:ubiquinone/menaquinone biosynthesis C-methylase UbiE